MAEDARRWRGWPVTPARVPGLEARRVPGMLQASWAFVPPREDGVAPCAAFVRKAPGSLFCALKIHIKSILAASMVFLLDVVSPLLGCLWGFTPGMWSPRWMQRKEGKVQRFARGPPLLNTQRSHRSQWEMEACGKAQEESQGLKRHGESGFFYCQMWVRLAWAPCG